MQFRDVSIEWLGGESFHIVKDSFVILINPLSQCKKKADIILFSSSHNQEPSSFESCIKDTSTIIMRHEGNVPEFKKGKLVTIGQGDVALVEDIKVIATLAQHEENEYIGFLIHTPQTKIYYAGDTEFIPEMNLVECDVALLPIDERTSMGVEDAAHAVNILSPEVSIPYKYSEEDFIKAEKFASIAKGFSEVHIINPNKTKKKKTNQ